MREATIIAASTSIHNTVNWIRRLINEGAKSLKIKQIAKEIAEKPDPVKEVFNYAYNAIVYKPNEYKKQQLRRVERAIKEGKGSCVDYSILQGALLKLLGEPFKLRVVKYITPGEGKEKESWHIYIVTKKGVILDPVLGHKQDGTDTYWNRPSEGVFNYELPYSEKTDYPMPSLEILQGSRSQEVRLGIAPAAAVATAVAILGDKCKRSCDLKYLFNKKKRQSCKEECVKTSGSTYKGKTASDLTTPIYSPAPPYSFGPSTQEPLIKEASTSSVSQAAMGWLPLLLIGGLAAGFLFMKKK